MASGSGFSMKISKSKSVSKTTKYGLFVPEKKKNAATIPVFRNDDDEDCQTDHNRRQVQISLSKEESTSMVKAKEVHEKALAEDPSVFDYDGVYDSIQTDRKVKADAAKQSREENKKTSRYISTLLEKSKIRERELDRVRERLAIKERADTDALYGDKERFITSAYKKKLIENKRWEEEDQRLQAKEEADDVVKKGSEGMAGFYSNLLTKNIAMGGEVVHSKSAYTAGRSKKEHVTPEDSKTSKEPKDDTLEEKIVPQEKKRKIEIAVKEPIVSNENSSSSKAKIAPEDAIAEAKRRFLERKLKKGET